MQENLRPRNRSDDAQREKSVRIPQLAVPQLENARDDIKLALGQRCKNVVDPNAAFELIDYENNTYVIQVARKCRNGILKLCRLLHRIDSETVSDYDLQKFYNEDGDSTPDSEKHDIDQDEQPEYQSSISYNEQQSPQSCFNEQKTSNFEKIITQSLMSKSLIQDIDYTLQYIPVTPWLVDQDLFPRLPLKNFNCPHAFERFDDETKLLAFFYQQGHYQQNLAATDLLKKLWNYDAKALAWTKNYSQGKNNNAHWLANLNTGAKPVLYHDTAPDHEQKRPTMDA